MPTLNHSINTLGRAGALFRAKQLEQTEIGAHDTPYLFCVCHHPNISQEALGRTLAVNKSNVARRLAALEQRGFVTRTPCADDRRVLLVNPTQKALDVLPLLRTISRTWMETITEGFTKEQTAQFQSLLSRAVENARAAIDREVSPCD
ncbi:MAG: MarR family transcriptional regulator [Clostridia bacterium]|nr:MarR family transcriptional regulator [Clostridia bacterium]